MVTYGVIQELMQGISELKRKNENLTERATKLESMYTFSTLFTLILNIHIFDRIFDNNFGNVKNVLHVTVWHNN